MKLIKTLLFLSILSVQGMAQVTSADIFVREPSLTAKDSLNAWASHKNVKQMNGFGDDFGEMELKRISNFSKGGKLESEFWPGSFFLSVYYTYSGDTTIIRQLMPDPSPYGGGDILNLEKKNSKGQTLAYYSEGLASVNDSMKTPEDGRIFLFENGLPVTTVYSSGEKEKTTYDSHGNVTKIKTKEKTETYRRVYVGDKLSESYYAVDNEKEKLFESFKFNAEGLLAESTLYGDYGSTKKYTYDAVKRLITETAECGTTKYTYNAGNRLVKEERSGCAAYPATYVTDYKYNEKGLLVSIVQKDSDEAKPRTETFSYTYWK
ncbi:MAG: hypothetical protein WCI92_07395 [Bacteroidota bacterium]